LFLRLGWEYTPLVMPSQLKRFQQTKDIHFLTFSCHDRLAYLATAAACDLFEQTLEQMRRRYVFHVFGYVVMPEHVHLLVSEPKRGMLDHAIQALKTSVSKQSDQRPFWLARYYDFNVHSEEKRIEKLKYIHRNPVTRGLVACPEDWKWSSFRHYRTGEAGTIEIESFWTAGKRAGLRMPDENGFLTSTIPP
jgi:putative transposase